MQNFRDLDVDAIMIIKEIIKGGVGRELDSTSTRYGSALGFCEHGNEPS
jgi:hypothetical protein